MNVYSLSPEDLSGKLQIGSTQCLRPPLITPHAQRERGKVIGRGVHIYIYIYIYMSVVEKKI